MKIIYILSLLIAFNAFSTNGMILRKYNPTSILIAGQMECMDSMALSNTILSDVDNINLIKRSLVGSNTSWVYAAGWHYTLYLLNSKHDVIEEVSINLITKQVHTTNDGVFNVKSFDWLKEIVPDSICDVVRVKISYNKSHEIINQALSNPDIFIDEEERDSLSMNIEGYFYIDSLESLNLNLDERQYLMNKYPSFTFDLEVLKDYNNNDYWVIKSNVRFYDLFNLGNKGKWKAFEDIEITLYGDRKKIEEFLEGKQ